MLKTKVKVGSVTNLSEARYCAGMGVDFLSFPVSSVDPKTYQEITSWVAGPKFGVETQTTTNGVEQYTVDFVETSINNLTNVTTTTNLIVSLTPGQWKTKKENLESVKSKILFLQFEVSALDAATESTLKEASKQFDTFVKLSTLADLDQVLQLPISGVSLEGSAEVKAGLKEYPLAEVLEKLEVD